jgi:hypothetical protein
MATVSMGQKSRMPSCPANFSNLFCRHVLMEADRRISIKDYRRKKRRLGPFLSHRFEQTRVVNNSSWLGGERRLNLIREAV